MVDISDKPTTRREARSQVKVKLGKELFDLIKLNQVKKGDILTVAKLAGIQGKNFSLYAYMITCCALLASKQTANLIPLCHQMNLTKVDIEIDLNETDHSAIIVSTVKLNDRTGAEMESLISSAIAALALYDMGKSVNKQIEITDLRLVHKLGGKSGKFEN